jgi:hypothetical protein
VRIRLVSVLAIAGWLWALYERRERCKVLDRYISHLDRDLGGRAPTAARRDRPVSDPQTVDYGL